MPDEEQKPGTDRQEFSCTNRGTHHRHVHTGSVIGGIWCIGWLFTLGYLHIPFFWKGVLALIIWPYYLGRALSKLPM